MSLHPLLSDVLFGGVACLLGLLLFGFVVAAIRLSGKISQEEERREAANHK